MLQDPAYPTVNVFPAFMGCFFILLALLSQRLSRFLGYKPWAEMFTTPRFQRSALINGRLGRICLALLGVGFLFQGGGALFLPGGVSQAMSLAALALAGVVILAMLGVTLAHWKA